MKNITVCVNDETYRQARVWAAQRDTSVSAVVQYLLNTLPKTPRAASAYPVAKPGSAKNAQPAPKASPLTPDSSTTSA